MKNKVKVLLAFLAVAALTLALTVTAIAVETPNYTGTVAECEPLVAAAEMCAAEEKDAKLAEVAEYLEEHPINPDDMGYDALMGRYCSEVFIRAQSYYSEIDPDAGAAECGVQINRLTAFYRVHPAATATEDFADFNASYEQLLSDHAEARQALRDEIADHIDLGEYDLPVSVDRAYDDGIPGVDVRQVAPSTSPVAKVGITSGDDGDNKYYTIRYDGGESGHCYFGYKIADGTDGFVVEFDVTTFDELPAAGTVIEVGGINGPNGKKLYPKYLTITASGDIKTSDGEVRLENAIAPGAWLHIAIAFDPTEYTYTLYVEDEKLATYSSKVDGFAFIPSLIRFGSNNVKGEISFDNMVVYEGTVIRDRDKLKTMSDSEEFAFYTKYLSDETNTAGGRKKAYDSASTLISKYWKDGVDGAAGEYLTDDEALRVGVDRYLAFSEIYDEVYNRYLTENLERYGVLAGRLLAYVRRPDTLADRQSASETIDIFVSKVTTKQGVDILDNDEYQALVADVNAAKELILQDENINIFIQKMTRFQAATTIVALERYYSAAKTLIDEGLDLSVILVDSGLGDGSTVSSVTEGYEEYDAAYAVFTEAAAKLEDAFRDYYAEVIIGCMDIIKEYDTEEEWLANYDLVNEYILIIRDTLATKDYNSEYIGLEDAIRNYTPINKYFYQDLQESHAEVLLEMLDKYAGTVSYAERLGVCSYIKGYLEKNDVDLTNELIAPLIMRYELYRQEIESQDESYAAILVQNSHYFINLVNDILTLTTYEEIKPLFDEAYVLYFALDASVPGTEEAITEFDVIYESVNLVEDHSSNFVKCVAVLAASEREGDRYSNLVQCCYYSENADESYAGVAEAMTIYRQAYAEYNGDITEANAERGSANSAVGSLRSTGGVSGMIAIIMKKVFG